MTKNTMQITALLPYFGGKRTLAARIVEELGPHSAYWEPFGGSLAVLLAKPQCPPETICELNDDVINLARIVQDSKLAPQLYRRLRRVWMCEVLFDEAVTRIAQPFAAGEPDLDRATDYMVASWMGRNGVAGTAKSNTTLSVRYTQGGGSSATRWCAAVDSIPAWRRRMRNVTILHRDAFETLAKIRDEPGTVIYADPPYLSESMTGSYRYVHDFDSAKEAAAKVARGEEPRTHERLAAALARFRQARVVLSYYDHPRLDALYPDWTKRYLATNKGLGNSRRGAKRTPAPEVLLINGPSRVEGRLF